MTLSLHIYKTSAKFLTKINVNKGRNDSWNDRNCFQKLITRGSISYLEKPILFSLWQLLSVPVKIHKQGKYTNIAPDLLQD